MAGGAAGQRVFVEGQMNQSEFTVLVRPRDRQFRWNNPAGVCMERRPELIGPQRTKLPSS